MAVPVFEETDLVVIETGPLKGVEPQRVYFGRVGDARAYVEKRRKLFEVVEVCRVLTRISTTMQPVELLEGNPIFEEGQGQ